MKQALALVSPVLGTKEIVPGLTNYTVDGGYLLAGDGRSVAGTPIDLEGSFQVPGAELNAILARMPDEAYTIEVDAGYMKIRAGRKHGKIPVLAGEAFHHPRPNEDGWVPYPQALESVLRAVRPFVSDNASHEWQVCIAIRGQEVVATNNIVLAHARCAGGDATPGLLPTWVVDFLLAADTPPVEWYTSENHVAFRWADGTWLRGQLVNDTFPDQVFDLAQSVIKPAWEIPGDWREAYEYVAGLSPNYVCIEEGRIWGQHGKAEVEHDAPASPVPQGGSSVWNPRFLTQVLTVATHWEPDKWPNPSNWVGPACRGIIVGRSA